MNPTTPFALHQWLAQLERLQVNGRCTCPDFLRPYHFATMALTLARKRTLDIQLPTVLTSYASRMGLWQAVGLTAPVQTQPLNFTGRYLPLQRLEDRKLVPDVARQLATITRTYGADAETTNAIEVSLMEIFENCFAHAEVDAPLKGLACAQSWPQGNLVQICIADCGIGIRASLSANDALHDDLMVRNSCELATEFGVTSKPELGHAGYGLALTRQLLEKANGRLIVLSGNEWMFARGSKCSGGEAATPWAGTLAVLEWRTSTPLRLKDVYESWPLPTGFDHDDFDF